MEVVKVVVEIVGGAVEVAGGAGLFAGSDVSGVRRRGDGVGAVVVAGTLVAGLFADSLRGSYENRYQELEQDKLQAKIQRYK